MALDREHKYEMMKMAHEHKMEMQRREHEKKIEQDRKIERGYERGRGFSLDR